jgi:hypothetical protein
MVTYCRAVDACPDASDDSADDEVGDGVCRRLKRGANNDEGLLETISPGHGQ